MTEQFIISSTNPDIGFKFLYNCSTKPLEIFFSTNNHIFNRNSKYYQMVLKLGLALPLGKLKLKVG